MTRDEIVARANTRADDDCQHAIALGIGAELGPEYIVSGDATGKRLLIPARAMAVGMLAYLKDAYARQHNHSDAA